MFSFPKNKERKKLWLESIGDHLKARKGVKEKKPNLFICADQFTKESFKNDTQKILKDGCTVFIPLKRFVLKDDSIPCIFEELQHQPCDRSRPLSNKTNNRRELSPASAHQVSVANEIIFIQKSNPVKVDNFSASGPTAEGTKVTYEINNLLNDWNSRNTETFPSNWGINDDIEQGVLFMCCGDVLLKVTRQILV
ncbi:uncharacterized protein LOC127290852 [Leptopilina boulardi]|uniref:uncharacterized protein LOC127290852 n=1 Tax=Leptopilina boulardi TaxID=63433 RepID=UPI0021F6463A|nr:uncharacterized protein LOC127290852 [Leptopilina boulardi]